jgi:magnesium chelatase family protein
LELVYIETIQDVIDVLSGQQLLPFVRVLDKEEEPKKSDRDFNQVIGHEFAKRALEIAASGEHFLLMDGPPGCGKSLLSKRAVRSCHRYRKKHSSKRSASIN